MGTTYNPWLGSAIALVMMVIVLVCMAIMNRFGEGEEGCRSSETVPAHRQPLLYAAGLGSFHHFTSFIVFSFNASKSWFVYQLTLIGTRSGSRTHDPDALWVTLAVSILAAVISTIIGTAAAIGFTNFRRRSRTVVTTINNIPLTNADIITGVSMMLFFFVLAASTSLMAFAGSCLWASVEPGLCHYNPPDLPTFPTLNPLKSLLPGSTAAAPNIYEAAQDLGALRHLAFEGDPAFREIMPGVINEPAFHRLHYVHRRLQ